MFISNNNKMETSEQPSITSTDVDDTSTNSAFIENTKYNYMFSFVCNRVNPEKFKAVLDDVIRKVPVKECLICNMKLLYATNNAVIRHKKDERHKENLKLLSKVGSANTIDTDGFRVYHGIRCKICKVTFDYPDEEMNIEYAAAHTKTENHKLSREAALKKQADAKRDTSHEKSSEQKLEKSSEVESYEITKDSLDRLFAVAEVNMNGTVNRKDFITSAMEDVLGRFWKQPQSQFYCRTCNYEEFQSEEELENHKISSQHLEFVKSYEDAFCLACQVHCGDEEGMDHHCLTSEHASLTKILKRTKNSAISYLKEVNVALTGPITDEFISRVGCLVCDQVFVGFNKGVYNLHKGCVRHQKNLCLWNEQIAGDTNLEDSPLPEDVYIHREGCTVCNMVRHIYNSDQFHEHKNSKVHFAKAFERDNRKEPVQSDEFVNIEGCSLCDLNHDMKNYESIRLHRNSVGHIRMLRWKGISTAQLAISRGDPDGHKLDQMEKDILNDGTVTNVCTICNVKTSFGDIRSKAVHIYGKKHRTNLKNMKGKSVSLKLKIVSTSSSSTQSSTKRKPNECNDGPSKKSKPITEVASGNNLKQRISCEEYQSDTVMDNSLYCSF